ncbi:hypothetical protein [Azospirillum largimobile]
MMGGDSPFFQGAFNSLRSTHMINPTHKPVLGDRHERTLDDLKMTNSSPEHDDGRVLLFLTTNEAKLIQEGIRRYDAITK